jgi:hypothetical protein
MKLQVYDCAFSLETSSTQAAPSNILRITFAPQVKHRTQDVSRQKMRRDWGPASEMVAYVTLELCALAVIALAASALSN